MNPLSCIDAGGEAGLPEILWDDGERKFCRSARKGIHGTERCIAVVPAADHPSRSCVRRLNQEFALREQLNGAWALRPVDLLLQGGRPILVLEDPGGEPLERLVGRPFETGAFLRLAAALAAALGGVHRSGLVHKDLKPANVLVDPAGTAAWLTGFGMASRLPRERQAPEAPEIIAGTLPYMSPEQTGRMNRSIDSRSDLYSLGVTLYQMLTGTLPFAAADPMGWVHCHIARRPISPSERVAVPAVVSAIVMKLLAKTAEDRYQTAAGVERDLRRCLAQWEDSGRIEPFGLGSDDNSDRLLIPETLYGREREVQMLLAAFDRVVRGGSPELVLVSGYSGIGKSSVVHELHKVIVPSRGLFAAGKFEQYRRDIPYASLSQAFQTLVRQLLAGSEQEVARWREALVDALGANGELMVRIIPELELVVGEQAPVPELPPQEAQVRFQHVLRRLLGVFARPEHPLVLFLDDLQWLDAATLALLVDLTTQKEVGHLLLVGAYRDNEVGPTHPLMRSLDAIRSAGATVSSIVLAPLRHEDVAALVADSLHCGSAAAHPLAELVHEKTAGNPFFAIQFLTALAEEQLLSYDTRAAVWVADLQRIHAKGYTANVVDLMVQKLERLPETTREGLKQLACIGSVASFSTLGRLCGQTMEAVHASLWYAVRDGLLMKREDSYAFVHDRVQEAAYSLVPPASRPEVHLRIGRALLSGMQPDEVIDVVEQLNRGAALLHDDDERKRVAQLNLRAGLKAKSSTAYSSAVTYLSAGMALLDAGAWERCYELTFSLWLQRAECEFLTGGLERAEALIAELLTRGKSKVDKAAAYRLKTTSHVLKGENGMAIETALACLALLGVDIPAHPTSAQVDQEYEEVWRTLGGRQIEDLLNLPKMTNSEMQAAMGMLADLFAPALFTDRNLLHLYLGRMVNLTLEHGTADASPTAYSWFGIVIGTRYDRYREGYCFGKLACDLVEKLDLVAYKAKAYFSMEMAALWTEPAATAIDYIRAAHQAAVEGGDVAVACYGCNHLVTDLLLRGDHLDDIWEETERGLEFARKARYGAVVSVLVAQQRFIQNMRGRTFDFSSFGDAAFDDAAFEEEVARDPVTTMVCWYWVTKLQARYLSGDYDVALDAARKAEELLWSSDGHIQLLDYYFYTALATAAIWHRLLPEKQREARVLVETHLQRLSVWAEKGAVTFRDRHALLQAEAARIDNRPLDAERLYEEAIQHSRTHRFIQNESLGYELAARFYAARGFADFQTLYLQKARHCYQRWGAEGKVRQLDREHPELMAPGPGAHSSSTIGAPIEHLELATVIKALQAVSGELVFEKMLDTLMRTAIEHAGAERGLLILVGSGGQRVAAEVVTCEDNIRVKIEDVAVSEATIPQSVLQYVLRTQDSLILNDAMTQGPHSTDPYVMVRGPRSVLCLPLLNQAKLIGALYLENTLASGVFVPARISVLKLLASEAAISLENTRLYRELAERESKFRRLVDANIIGVFMWDLAGRILDANDAFLRMVGYERADLESGVLRWRDLTAPEWRALDDRHVPEIQAAGSLQPYEKEYIHRNGGRVPVLIGSALFEGAANEGVAFVLDLSERKRAEAEARSSERRYHDMELRLAEANRMACIGQLSASVAHELNQPLLGIVANASACLRKLASVPPRVEGAQETARRLLRDAHRASEVIVRLRALFTKGAIASDRVDLNEAAREVIALSSTALRNDGVDLQCEFAEELPPVSGDRIQLQQVIMNLLRNALDAMRVVEDRPRRLTIRTGQSEQDYVQLTVQDTGVGLDRDGAERLFEAFYTTKSSGMGIGLSVSRSIIEQHRGRLWARPNDGPGASFMFAIPSLRQVQHELDDSKIS